MARTNQGGKSVRLVLQWLLNREEVTDRDLGEALGKPRNTYSNRKEQDDYPSFEELDLIGTHFGISPRMLQIAFGLRGEDELVLLSPEELARYREQGGVPPEDVSDARPGRRKYSARGDADPL